MKDALVKSLSALLESPNDVWCEAPKMERSTNRSCLPSPSTPLHNHDNDETMKRANRLEELRVTHHQTNSVINGR